MFHLAFAPEHWLKVHRFQQFLGPPFPDHPDVSKGTTAVENHLSKFQHIANLANRLRPSLAEDASQLKEAGYTPAQRSHEYAALVETLFCELYACLDGLRRAIYGTYQRVRGIQKDSTEKLFARAFKCEYGPEFPEEIRSLLATAYRTWFPELRRIRTEVTHGQVGFCHLEQADQIVTYYHSALGSGPQAFVIRDVASKINTLASQVLTLTEDVFEYWYTKLYSVERRVICGIWNGRFYQRDVAPGPELSSASGRCYSAWWFRHSAEPTCPLADSCHAFTRREGQVRQLAQSMWEQRGRPLWDDQADWFKAEEALSKAYMGEATSEGSGSQATGGHEGKETSEAPP